MAGRIVNVLPKNTYSVTAATLPAAQVVTFPVALSVPVSDGTYGALVLRCHSFSVAAGTGTAPKIRAFANVSAPTEEDPNTLYRGAVVINGTAISGSATFTPAVDFSFQSAVANLGSFVDVQLEITQWGTTAAALTIVASADLVIRS